MSENAIIFPQGDDVTLTAEIDDAAGVDLDLTGSTVTFIVYDSAGSAAFTKTASITTALQGKISVDIEAADTASLSGIYTYKIKVVDSSSNISTVRVDMFLIVTNQNVVDKENVRILVGDTDTTDQLLTDAQIYFFLLTEGNIYKAAAKAARSIQGKFSRTADISIESVKKSYSQRAQAYAKLADNLERQASTKIIPSPVVTGISNSEMESQRSTSDRPKENFYIGKFDNPNSQFDDSDGNY